MSKRQAIEILKQRAQRITEQRVALLELLMDCSKAFAFTEIEEQLSLAVNRVTIYRTLQTFEDVGLVIKMVNRRGISRYMFNHEAHNNTVTHPHLRCKSCDMVICLPCLPNEYLEQLQKYEIDDLYFLIDGVCPKCLTENAKLI